MADPGHGLTVGDWLQVIVGTILTAAIAGIGAAMAWFKKSKEALTARIGAVESKAGDHAMDIAVLKTHQENNMERLSQIQETTRDTNQKVDHLQETLTDVLLTVKHRGP